MCGQLISFLGSLGWRGEGGLGSDRGGGCLMGLSEGLIEFSLNGLISCQHSASQSLILSPQSADSR